MKFTSIEIPLQNLVKNVLIAGVPGSGKTMAGIGLMLTLNRHRIPCICLDCAKRDYRAIKNLRTHGDPALRRFGEELQVFTPGQEYISPFRQALLAIEPWATAEDRVDALVDCFDAALPMGGPLGPLLYEALLATYTDAERYGYVPVLDDLLRVAGGIVTRQKYSAATEADIVAALKLRVGRLTRGRVGRMFRASQSTPTVGLLTESWSSIECGSLDPYALCIVVLNLLTAISTHVRSLPPPTSVPRLMLIIEEAHRLLIGSGSATPSEEHPDPQAYVAQKISLMLAELRSAGVGVVISDQSPSKLPSEVIKHCGTKLAFRLVHPDDRSAMGASMLFGDMEYENLARLLPGEAYLFTEGHYAPELIRTVNLSEAI